MQADSSENPIVAVEGLPQVESAKTRLRIRFTKRDDLRWISHRDLARVWERLLRRAGLQLAFSQGFHPKPRISFPSALALGIEALDEVVELEVLGVIELESIHQAVCRELPEGMELLQLESLKTSLGKAKVLGATYRIPHGLSPTAVAVCQGETSQAAAAAPPAELTTGLTIGAGNAVSVRSLNELQQRIADIQQLATVQIDRDGKSVVCATDDPHFDLKIEHDYLVFCLPNVAQGSIRPSELLAHVGLGQLLEDGVTLQRTAVHLQEPAGAPGMT